MKVILAILVLVISLNLSAEELKEKKYYLRGAVEVPATNPMYPVLKMIEAFIVADAEKAKGFCTTECVKSADSKRNLGFSGTGIDDFQKTYDQSQKMKLKFYPEVNGEVKIAIVFYRKDRTANTRNYRVKQIDGKWLVTKY